MLFMLGEIEPCKLEVKASSQLRRFNALKEVRGVLCDVWCVLDVLSGVL